MTLMQDLLQNSVTGIGVTQVPENLNILATQDCAAAIWQRRPLPDFQTWIDGLDPAILPSVRLILKPQDVVTVLSEVCDTSLVTDRSHWRHLIKDIAKLSRLFCDLMTAPYVRLRLEPITSNACRKFHIDAITARLVCTYRGTGTQYGISHDGAEPERIFTVPTGTPILLRGTLWPEQPRSGLLHRSPPIEGSGETRLVLVLDPICDLEDET
ncbi:DUF1826 domain-containing protein [Sulfitobacter sp. SK012]|uniref:DUF1826 domain-containing protein n=1 Tax=Sulfitobacter sp. SK012 TaxID=1389005 RepID=UPI000E0C9460|nr:DUF1826 domain-containing protein [Sulfitobacter sp. SK012]AXI47602.1 DUF1826 domain-containing protein [Sulfitobacter sp. SK012]